MLSCFVVILTRVVLSYERGIVLTRLFLIVELVVLEDVEVVVVANPVPQATPCGLLPGDEKLSIIDALNPLCL